MRREGAFHRCRYSVYVCLSKPRSTVHVNRLGRRFRVRCSTALHCAIAWPCMLTLLVGFPLSDYVRLKFKPSQRRQHQLPCQDTVFLSDQLLSIAFLRSFLRGPLNGARLHRHRTFMSLRALSFRHHNGGQARSIDPWRRRVYWAQPDPVHNRE